MKKSVKHKFQYLLFFLLSMPAFIFASAQDIRVNIDFTKASLGSVLNEIGRQASLTPGMLTPLNLFLSRLLTKISRRS